MKQLELLIGKMMASRPLLHVSFCLAFAVVFSFSVVLSGNYDVTPAAMVTCLYILTCTYVGRWYGKSWLNRAVSPPSLPKLLSTFAALSLAGGAGAAYMFKGDIPNYFLQNLAVCFPVTVLFVFFGISVALARHSLWMQVKEAQIAQQQKESELRLLLSQLSPHFLFNTLNNIYGISLTQHQRVPELLLKLSELLRYAVYETRDDFIPLRNELLYLKNYIDFEKIQTGDKLILEVNMDEVSDDRVADDRIRIAPMLLIVFVENAFKYAKATRKPKIFVSITLSVADEWITFTVKNSCGPASEAGTEEPSGIGLHHTLKRLHLIYGKDCFYNAAKNNDNYIVELRLKTKNI